MLKTLGIVQACCHARQFRCRAARKLGGRSVLEWVIRHVTESLRLDGVIVLVCDDADHRFMRNLVPADVPFFVGTKPDSLGRFSQALEQYATQDVIRIRGDHLFIDPSLIDRLVTTAAEHPQFDYISYCSRDGQPAILSPVGVYAEWIRASALHKAARHAKHPEEREHVTRFIYSHPEKFNIRLIPAPAEIDRDDVRLTVEMEEDWDHVLTIYEALGPDKMDWRRISHLLDQQPALRSRMAALNRDTVHAQW
ncbi:MAG: NTP transferase domain-containing protein [Thermoguttaceae bacterium]|jgi:spore coat polysaccharide biosynthesis protein SpsF